jgi:tetratricopeptide (TPR) repeat protein
VDNADDLSMVQSALPQRSHGSLLLTTRAHAVGALAASLEVETMGLVEGAQLLFHRAQQLHASEEERNEAMNIVIALDGFPLALDQAGAYIEETGCSFADYLQLYQAHRQALLARRGRQASNYPDSVATTWSLSFQKIEQANPAAAELLRLCAFLAPDRIPEELIIEGAAHWPPALQHAAADRFIFNQLVEELLAFSLVKRRAEDHLLSIHRLVQAVQRETIEPGEQRQWAERIVCAVNTVFPFDPKDNVASWSLCLRYLEQAQACDGLTQQYQLVLSEAAELLERTGSYLYSHASYTLAESLYQRAFHIRERQMGPEHPLVASALNGLADLHLKQGRYTEAESFYQRALRIWEQQLEPEHPEMASALKGLANLYGEQGKNVEAEPLYQRALRIWEQQLGPEHPGMAHPLSGLANLYADQEKYAEAEPLYQRALRIWEQQLGPEHPDMAYPLNNLAALYTKQGNYSEAESLYQRALRIRTQQLGSEHPLVASTLNGLANLSRERGKYAEAESLYQRALSIRESALGLFHSDTAEALYDFAMLQEARGNLQEAAALYRRALAIREQVYGLQHSKTTETSARLRAVLAAPGQTESFL